MKKLIIYISILISTVNCAGFKKNESDGLPFSKNKIESINGIYSNQPSYGNGSYVKTLTDILDRNIDMFNWKEKYNGKNIDVRLEIIKKNKLNVKIFESEKLMCNKNLHVKQKKDGFIYLREKRFMLDGIPLIFGGWNIQKSRFIIDENKNLHIQTNYFFCNGFLVVMSDWKTHHYNFIFEKH